MKPSPASAQKLYRVANEAGWDTHIGEGDPGTWTQKYDDGSENVSTVPTLQVYCGYGDIYIAAGWLLNPVSNRWCLSEGKGVIARRRTDDEFPDATTRTLNRVLGNDFLYWDKVPVKVLTDMLETETPDEVVRRVNSWT